MSRTKRIRNMDVLIASIENVIIENQCSLLEKDVTVLTAAIAKLQMLKSKKGLTDKHLKQEVVEIFELINQFLTK